MALKVETDYLDKKTGQRVQLKTAKMQLMGKCMDDSERHEFVVLKDGIDVSQPNTQFNKSNYVKYKMFVKYEGQDSAFNLELSQQAYNTINPLNPQKFDRIVVTKSLRTIPKTGALMPIVVAELIKGNQHQDNKPVQQQLKTIDSPLNDVEADFIKDYCIATSKEQRGISHFIGVYVRSKMADDYFVKRLEWLYDNQVKSR